MKQIFEMARKVERRTAHKKLYVRIAVVTSVFLCLGTVILSQVERGRHTGKK